MPVPCWPAGRRDAGVVVIEAVYPREQMRGGGEDRVRLIGNRRTLRSPERPRVLAQMKLCGLVAFGPAAVGLRALGLRPAAVALRALGLRPVAVALRPVAVALRANGR